MRIHLIMLCLLPAFLATARGQATLTLTSGASWVSQGGTHLVLDDTGLAVSGTYDDPAGTVHLRGILPVGLWGAVGLSLHSLEVDKTGGWVALGSDAEIRQELRLSQGWLDLTQYQLQLGLTGYLSGEDENAYVTATGTGYLVRFDSPLAGVPLDAGNLGLTLTSGLDLGFTEIRRYHQPYAVGTSSSLGRSYAVLPTVNSGLNAAVTFTYRDGEMGSLLESDLSLFGSDDQGTSWTHLGYSSRDAATNEVVLTGLNSLGFLTAANVSSFPVTWLSFDAWATGSAVDCYWQTASELNTRHFVVERSHDQVLFMALGEVPAAGYSQSVRNYTFQDPAPRPGMNYYRLRQVDLDGQYSYSAVVAVRFEPDEMDLSVYPNPATTYVMVQLPVAAGVLSLHNALGQTVGQWPVTSQEMRLPLERLAEGSYYLRYQHESAQRSRRVEVRR